MYWRLRRKDWAGHTNAGNKAAFSALVATGEARGVLAFEGDVPVGWCAVAPRPAFVRLERSRLLKRDAPSATWALNCLFIPSAHRGRGVARALVAAATAYAFEQGATEVEAYPKVVPPGARISAGDAWTGVSVLYEALGYAPLPGHGGRLWVKRVG